MRRGAILGGMLVAGLTLPAGAAIRVERGPDGRVIASNMPAGAVGVSPGSAALPASGTVPSPSRPAAARAAAPREITSMIGEIARRHGVSPELVKAVVTVESSFDARAVSSKGARGLMQLMPSTAQQLGVDDAYDPRGNLDGGIRHLRDLLDRYDGDTRLALAAYNAGEEAVRRHGGIPPYPETRSYVRKVLEELERWKRAAPDKPENLLYMFRDASGRLVVSNVAAAAARSAPQ